LTWGHLVQAGQRQPQGQGARGSCPGARRAGVARRLERPGKARPPPPIAATGQAAGRV